ncbi:MULTISPECIES: TraR/DksA family transcriptional regulator [Streptomyces]|uniref:Molecular chaperone DnaK n=1 Tax=Streptomyces cacaoi TaxID=1898 RepID=A0A4Y3QXG3_STRCI|nr:MULTISPECIES: TraR/DksA C4-type zinc finger protein [Streptomyces]NNG83582.1 molecular chaperone DnaK [Streptomyces cacaoi]QHF96529.1 molecular chaperone DnaK [Streptomyces sp. NHF165]GEB50084.1 molecular chaperone DnaK [Streptomyces cacaoi]
MPSETARHARLTEQDARRRLEHERTARQEQLRALAEAGAGADGNLVAAQEEAVRRVLAEVDAAFERLGTAAYGVCEGCGALIPPERLEILPYARCCVGCRARTQ